jgi:hypothetical protein
MWSQRDLAREIAEAERDERLFRKVARKWNGARVTWTVDVIAALCRTREACHALPFDRLGADRAIVQGWMPRLDLDPASFAALRATCGGTSRCPVTVEATIADLVVSPEEPTSLTLAAAELAAPWRAPTRPGSLSAGR